MQFVERLDFERYDTDILRDTFGFDASTTKSVALEDLHQGCPARDCIPSIDSPKYVSAEEAAHVADEDMVVAISLHGDQRAYPARILDRHEIVNDTIGGVPIAITWCPLCGSAVGIEREVIQRTGADDLHAIHEFDVDRRVRGERGPRAPGEFDWAQAHRHL